MPAPQVSLPDHQSTPSERDAPSSETALPTADPPADEPISILLVDDEPKNLTVLETILADPGYRLVRAESADQALLALVAEEFALIVLDIHMPGMSGFELAQMIKQRRKTSAVPIIFLTAYYSEDQHVLEGYGTGAVDYLHKPVNSAILRSKVAVFAELYRKTRESVCANLALREEVAERCRVQEEVLRLNNELEQRVEERTSELLRTNIALRESEQRLQLAQQAGKVGVWEWDLRTGAGAWTDAAREVFGLDDTGHGLTYTEWLSCIHADDREQATKAVAAAGASGRYWDEFRVMGRDHNLKWVELVGAVEYDNGMPARMRGAVRDITERKKIELELKDSNRRKDQFLAMLGHELRNPLAPIRNAVSIIREVGPDDPELNWCRDVLDRQTDHLTRLVDDLLDVSRVSRGKIQLNKEILEVSTAVQQALETSQPLIESRHHKLLITYPQEPLRVEADFTRLAQVVANILNNAAKYTDEGGTIWITVEHEPGVPGEATVRIRDTGRGLDTQSLAHVFDLFYQADRNLDRSEGGLGIGLALVRSIVEMHGGTVEAQSAGLGHGSEFIVRLPCVPPDAGSVAKPGPVGTDNQVAHGIRILIVDDNLDCATSMGKLMTLLGHEVLYAHDGMHAVEVALRERPGVIFLDIGLPKLNGYQACQSLREQGLHDTRIIAMTGYGQDDDRKLSQEAGFDNHLIKPASLLAIEQILAQVAAKE